MLVNTLVLSAATCPSARFVTASLAIELCCQLLHDMANGGRALVWPLRSRVAAAPWVPFMSSSLPSSLRSTMPSRIWCQNVWLCFTVVEGRQMQRRWCDRPLEGRCNVGSVAA